jgi:hypothetical protein
MAVLVEAISVVVRIPAIQEKYPGGWGAFKKHSPNNTLCADPHLARLGFMIPTDVESFVKELENEGLVFVEGEKTIDIVIVDQYTGFTKSCDWAEFGSVDVEGNAVKACRAVEDKSGQLMLPDGWKFDGSISQTSGFAPTEHVDKSLKFLRHENGSDVYLNNLTGKEVYVGRTGER